MKHKNKVKKLCNAGELKQRGTDADKLEFQVQQFREEFGLAPAKEYFRGRDDRPRRTGRRKSTIMYRQ